MPFLKLKAVQLYCSALQNLLKTMMSLHNSSRPNLLYCGWDDKGLLQYCYTIYTVLGRSMILEIFSALQAVE